jgi:hypothetical protein
VLCETYGERFLAQQQCFTFERHFARRKISFATITRRITPRRRSRAIIYLPKRELFAAKKFAGEKFSSLN